MSEFSVKMTVGGANSGSERHNTDKKHRVEHLGYDKEGLEVLVNKDLQTDFNNTYEPSISSYNADQIRKKHPERQLDFDYYTKVSKSEANHSVKKEIIMSVGDILTTGKNNLLAGNTRELSKDVLREWFSGFEVRNPEMHVTSAAIHADEPGAVHLHLIMYVAAKNGDKPLISYSLDKAISNIGLCTEGTSQRRQFKAWVDRESDVLRSLIVERGHQIFRSEEKINRSLQSVEEYRELASKTDKERREIISEIDKNMEPELMRDGRLYYSKQQFDLLKEGVSLCGTEIDMLKKQIEEVKSLTAEIENARKEERKRIRTLKDTLIKEVKELEALSDSRDHLQPVRDDEILYRQRVITRLEELEAGTIPSSTVVSGCVFEYLDKADKFCLANNFLKVQYPEIHEEVEKVVEPEYDRYVAYEREDDTEYRREYEDDGPEL